MVRSLRFLLVGMSALLAACASFPQSQPGLRFANGLSAAQIFDACMAAHGGDIRAYPGDINLSTDGHWYRLIQRIQPIVSDAGFRVTSEERYRPRDGLYSVHHEGPLGSKQVVRTADAIAVFYNGTRETDPARIRATAMTNDAFRMFHFGPSFIKARATEILRIADAREGGRDYRRLLATVRPGFGEAAQDQVVLWIDAQSSRLFRVHMTLNGFETTQGAQVDTTFLEYRKVGPFLLPVRFHERVRGPLRIDAHDWHTTGIDLDRSWSAADVGGPAFEGAALPPAAAMREDVPDHSPQ
ncbi:hypothetical protein [Dokdonella immobilis]|uniref:Outer membrane lipoprotein-sorting protein n=1 Tax=Dokdonella immobilis TaxID=578942 RepID=A0A1I4YUJ9_9GAMM|nr:hypothetical protein [Dokdonella immobilis]SFN41708.1 hypothetical protein SAMN05216289_12026 [Dokdonella immobilis]